MNYFPFHLGDYAAHTQHLEPMEDLAYRRMLDLYYLTEKELPRDPEEVARKIRMREYVKEVTAVLREFFTETDQGWFHDRCHEEVAKMQDKQNKARASAAASVKARATNVERTLNERSTNVEQTLNEGSADVQLPTPIPIPNKELATKRRTQLPEGFTPNEVGRAKAGEKGLLVETELAKFSDYHRAKGSVMLDWQAAWRTWIGNARPAVADVARQTVPSSPGRDPALIKAEEDSKRAVPIPDYLRETIAQMTGKKVAA